MQSRNEKLHLFREVLRQMPHAAVQSSRENQSIRDSFLSSGKPCRAQQKKSPLAQRRREVTYGRDDSTCSRQNDPGSRYGQDVSEPGADVEIPRAVGIEIGTSCYLQTVTSSHKKGLSFDYTQQISSEAVWFLTQYQVPKPNTYLIMDGSMTHHWVHRKEGEITIEENESDSPTDPHNWFLIEDGSNLVTPHCPCNDLMVYGYPKDAHSHCQSLQVNEIQKGGIELKVFHFN